MDIVRKTITVPKQMDEWIKTRIEGRYTNDSEYLRDLIRHDMERKERFITVKSALESGEASGISQRSVEDIWQQAEDEYKGK